MRILNIVDIAGWAFYHNCKALEKYGGFDYTIRFGRENKYKRAFKKLEKYDLVLYWTDVRPDYLVKRKAPGTKTVVMIRSDVRLTTKKKRYVYWKETNLLKNYLKAFMCANKEMLKWTRKKFPMMKSYYAPGGVDTALFVPPVLRNWGTVPKVGWAGSKKQFGAELKGLPIIKEAVEQLGWEYCPAYRESGWRNQRQMVQYYGEIDLYVDMWVGAGRQNGVLEAMACGVPSVCCEKGIARELVDGGLQIANRSVDSVKAALQRAWKSRNEISKQSPLFIEEYWSWKLWASKFEEIINQIKRM